jgi:rhodanese-related sulfurtransferase
MKTWKVFSILALWTMACGPGSAQSSQRLTAADFEKKITTVADKTVLDVRTPDEYQEGHLAGAIMIDINKSDFKAKLAKLDKNKPVFVYCAGGGRSGSATEVMEELGFKQVYDLKGGLNAWKKAGKPVSKK